VASFRFAEPDRRKSDTESTGFFAVICLLFRMTVRTFLTFLALFGLLGTSSAVDRTPLLGGPATVSDSALDELSVGRYWHATRMLRAEGAAEGGPADVLVLARAEAGWEHWPAVRELLEGAPWLADASDGVGQYLLGRALEDAQRWADASKVYGDFVDHIASDDSRRPTALVRRARTAWSAGDTQVALSALNELHTLPVARSWAAVELTLAAAEGGDAAGVQALSAHVIEPAALVVVWRAEADAILQAGDPVSAERTFRSLRDASDGSRRAEATVEVGRLRVAAGDSSEGRALLLEGIEAATGAARVMAAASLMDLGGHDFARTLELAQILDRAGDGARALRGYDRALSLQSDGVELPEASRLERARLMGTVASRREEAIEEFRSIRESTQSERIGARNLEVWAQLRGRQGMTAQVTTLRRWLLEEYPTSNEAAEVAWSQGSNAEAGGSLSQALDHYGFLVEHVPSHARAGQARMRSGQIHLRRGNLDAAAEVFEQYLEDFPTGRRWQEAAYWAGRTRMELGHATVGERHLNHVLTQPVEYYAVMAADLLDVPFAVGAPAGAAPAEPGWLTEGLARLDVLTEAGLEPGAASEISRLRQQADGARGPLLRLADGLIERGRTIDGINIGWALLESEGSWDQELLRIIYPFPYRELVRREAKEWGIDPFMMAAIIRQESAFKADIVSSAGAIGLMQVMPPTGAQLARTHGPAGFTDQSLTKPEVNLHLGAAFFVDMSRRYDDDLPLVLSAYNAGPTRATRWRRFSEVSDQLRFTERIPFDETRGYVKSVRRNLGLYRALYGQD